jgi:hypothetical protein
MSGDYEFIRAPWSSEQVDALNRFQRRGDVHEFTCPEDHGGSDRTLIATKEGWLCPHCAYRQDWAHPAMIAAAEYVTRLPCDVMLPPATIIRKGCDYATLFVGLKAREGIEPELCRFDDPADKLTFKRMSGEVPIRVRSADYAYDGRLAGFAVKKSGAVRYVVEDANRRLFIHNHIQIGVAEGWLPEKS